MKAERRSGGFDRVIPEARRPSDVRHTKKSISQFRDGRPELRVQHPEEEQNPPKQIYTDLTPQQVAIVHRYNAQPTTINSQSVVINISRNYNVSNIEAKRASPAQTLESGGRYQGSSLIPAPPRSALIPQNAPTVLDHIQPEDIKSHNLRSSSAALGKHRKSERRSPSPQGQTQRIQKRKKKGSISYRKHSESFREDSPKLGEVNPKVRGSGKKQHPISLSSDFGALGIPFSPQSRASPLDLSASFQKRFTFSHPNSPDGSTARTTTRKDKFRNLPPLIGKKLSGRRNSGNEGRVATASGARTNTLKMMYSHIQPPSTADGKRVGLELPKMERRLYQISETTRSQGESPLDESRKISPDELQKVAEEEQGQME